LDELKPAYATPVAASFNDHKIMYIKHTKTKALPWNNNQNGPKIPTKHNFTKNRNTIKTRRERRIAFGVYCCGWKALTEGQRLVSHYSQLPLTDRMSSSQNNQTTNNPANNQKQPDSQ